MAKAKTRKALYQYDINNIFISRAMALWGMTSHLGIDPKDIISTYKINMEDVNNLDKNGTNKEMVELAYFCKCCLNLGFEEAVIVENLALVDSKEGVMSDIQHRYIKKLRKDTEKKNRELKAVRRVHRNILDRDLTEIDLAFGSGSMSGIMFNAVLCAVLSCAELLYKGSTVEEARAKVWEAIKNGPAVDNGRIPFNGYTEMLEKYISKIDENPEVKYSEAWYSDRIRTLDWCLVLGQYDKAIVRENVKLYESSKLEIKDTFVVDPVWTFDETKKITSRFINDAYGKADESRDTKIKGLTKRELKASTSKLPMILNAYDFAELAWAYVRSDINGHMVEEVNRISNINKNEAEKSKREVQRKLSKLEQTRDENKKLKEKCEKLNSEVKKLQKHKEGLSEDAKKSYIKEIEALNKKIFNTERENGIVEDKNSELMNKVAELEDKIKDLECTVELYEEELKTLDKADATEYNIEDNIAEIRGFIGNRRLFLVGSTDKWRETMGEYFNNYIDRSVDNMSVDEIGTNDIVLLSIRQMKHCISKPVWDKCRKLGVLCVVLNETNLKQVMRKLHMELKAEAGMGQGWFYGIENQ